MQSDGVSVTFAWLDDFHPSASKWNRPAMEALSTLQSLCVVWPIVSNTAMRTSCQRDDLRRGLHGTLPGAAIRGDSVLSHVHIEAAEDAIVLTTFNRRWWMRKALSAETIEPGAVTVPAKLMTELVDALASDTLDLSIGPSASDLDIKGADGQLAIRAGIVDLFPQFPIYESVFTARVETFALLKAVQLTSVAATTADEGPLSGIRFAPSQGHLVIAASDGSRLAERLIDAVSGDDALEFTVPAVAIRELRELASAEPGVCKLTLAPKRNLAAFTIGRSSLVTSTIEGDFPNYRELIPTDRVVRSRVVREHLLARLRAALLLAPPEGNRLHIEVVGKDRLLMSCEAPDRGSGHLEIVASNEAAAAEVYVDGNALRAGIEAMDASSIDLFVGVDRHLVVRPADGSGELYLVVHKQRPPSADFRS